MDLIGPQKDFRPAPGLGGCHAQTIVGRYLRPKKGVHFRRERFETHDNDFVHLDFADVPGAEWSKLGEGAPIALLLHGLEGSSRSGYAFECYKRLAHLGIRPVGFNFRSCSGEMNLTGRLYHSGDTTDPAAVIGSLRDRFPNVPLCVIGVSLGGNVLLKYLGETGTDAGVSAAVVVSVPYDLSACASAIHVGASQVYGRFMLKRLQKKLKLKRSVLESTCDVEAGLRATTMRAFDEAITAPCFGFTDAEDYYTQSSSRSFLNKITVPTLILGAMDDPFLPPESIPLERFSQNSNLVPCFSKHGGHVGFVSGRKPMGLEFWAEREASAFVARVVNA